MTTFPYKTGIFYIETTFCLCACCTFTLARLFNVSQNLRGKIVCQITHYITEYGFGSKLSTEGDVYRYGIIILEMLTGKRPTDEMFTNGLNLHKFVEQAFPQKIREVLDPCIILSPDGADVFNNLDHANNATAGVEACILHLAKLGLTCSMEAPNDRPTTQDIYADVIKIKEAFAAIYMIE